MVSAVSFYMNLIKLLQFVLLLEIMYLNRYYRLDNKYKRIWGKDYEILNPYIVAGYSWHNNICR